MLQTIGEIVKTGQETFFAGYKIIKEKGNCLKHGEYIGEVWQELKTGKVGYPKCPLCVKEIEAKNNEIIEKERKRLEHIKLCKECNIEPEYYYKTLDNYVAYNETQNRALEAVRALVKEKKGKVVLLGSNGLGKTHLATAAVKAFKGKIYSVFEISSLIRRTYSKVSRVSEYDMLENLASCAFLAIDEVGKTIASESEKHWLSYIIDKRHTRRLPFIIISNLHLMKSCKYKNKGGCTCCFERYFNLDVLSRLRDASVIEMQGRDLRGEIKDG